ncbi:MAG: preprotein translocase subunit YajC [Pirellulaceae bacterium]
MSVADISPGGIPLIELAVRGVLIGQQQPEGGGIAQVLMQVLPFAAIGILFYLMLIRPESQKRQQLAQKLSELKKNDRVVTVGGIYGTVVNVTKDSDDVTIRIDENNNTRVRILRSAISRIVSGEDGGSKADE